MFKRKASLDEGWPLGSAVTVTGIRSLSAHLGPGHTLLTITLSGAAMSKQR